LIKLVIKQDLDC